MEHSDLALAHSHDPALVLLSIAIAIGAAWVALDLAARTAAARGSTRGWWLAGGAVAMGIGIFSMHYIGMLAYALPVPIRYDIPMVVASLGAAVGASGIGLLFASRDRVASSALWIGGLMTGAGIVAMHYLGMAAMRLPAVAIWSGGVVALSAVIAVAASSTALWLTFRVRGEARTFAPAKVMSAVVMGLAIASMHYTGMMAASFVPSPAPADFDTAITVGSVGIAGLTAACFVVFGLSIVTSLVDRRMAARADDLAVSEERYRSLFTRSLAGVYQTRPDGVVIDCNDAFAGIYGYASRDECLGVGLGQHVSPEAVEELGLALIRDGRITGYEMPIRRKDGSEGWVLVNATWTGRTSDETGIVEGTTIDVTERRRLQDAMARSVEIAEEASRAKSEFLANMSHEIRTPMNGIIGMTELALGTHLTAEQRGYLETVAVSAESLMRLLDDILDFSKIEAQKLHIESVDFDLGRLLDDLMRLTAGQAHQKGLELACDMAPDVPAALEGDPVRLRQVLTNLLSNAVKFTQHGEVVVRVVVEEDAGERVHLHFTVSDTGIGIPANKQTAIFAAFTQADSSTTRRFGGTGLGLAISARLVQLMGGRIWVESEPDRGSTFHVILPFVRRAVAVTDGAPVGDADLQGVPVLVVDDNATNRWILRDMLSQWGMVPTIVEDGPAALVAMEEAAADGRPFGLVLMDYQMPVMSGLDVAGRMRQRTAATGPIVLMLSSVGQGADVARASDVGITASLTKPVRQSVLKEAVLSVLGRQSSAAAPVPARGTAAAPARRLTILLAEDNAVNQRLFVALLEKHGHTVTLVDTGKAAVDAVATQVFDVILMDLQMPVMGGLEATQLIRQAEAGTGRRVPIVALTAHALKGDRERCLAAGMDEYLAKPVLAPALLSVLDAVTRRPGSGADGNGQAAPEPGASIDLDAVLARVEGDRDLLAELTRIFGEQAALQLASIRSAIDTGDALTLERTAHALRGAVANFGAREAVRLAHELELAGRQGDLTMVSPLAAELDAEVGAVEDALQAFIAGESA